MENSKHRPDFLILNEKFKVDYQNLILIRNVGKGSYGLVSIYKDSITQKEWAVKEIFTSSLDQDEIICFKQELALLSNCTHDSIIKFFGYYETDDKICYLMNYMRGGNLKQFVKNFPPSHSIQKFILKIMKSTVEALIYLQKNFQVSHRDIKSENLLLDEDLNVFLADFGTVKYNPQSMTAPGSVIGTPLYMPPELLESFGYLDIERIEDSVDKQTKRVSKFKNKQFIFNFEKCDIFSLGMTIVECLSYEQFNSKEYKGVINKKEHILLQYIKEIVKKHQIDDYLTEIIIRMVDFNYKKRPSLKELHMILENIELKEQNKLISSSLQNKSIQLMQAEIKLEEMRQYVNFSQKTPLQKRKMRDSMCFIDKSIKSIIPQQEEVKPQYELQQPRFDLPPMNESIITDQSNNTLNFKFQDAGIDQSTIIKGSMGQSYIQEMSKQQLSVVMIYEDFVNFCAQKTQEDKSLITGMNIKFDSKSADKLPDHIFTFCRMLPLFTSLIKLEIDFSFYQIDDEALNYIGRSIQELSELQELNMNLATCSNTDPQDEGGLMVLSVQFISNLMFTQQSCLTGKSLELFCHNLLNLKNLSRLKINFFKNVIEQDNIIIFLRTLTRHKNLSWVNLDFQRNKCNPSTLIENVSQLIALFQSKMQPPQQFVILA